MEKCVGGSAFPASRSWSGPSSGESSTFPLPRYQLTAPSFLPVPSLSLDTRQPSSVAGQQAWLWEGDRLRSPQCLGGLLLIGL